MVCLFKLLFDKKTFSIFIEPTDWNSAIQELLEKQGVDIKHEMEKK